LDDLIVGAYFADPSHKSSAGKSYVVFGKANSGAINLSAIADASNPLGGFVINGEQNPLLGCLHQQSHLDQWHYYRLYQTQHKIYLHLNW
jgi:hypothetical protein